MLLLVNIFAFGLLYFRSKPYDTGVLTVGGVMLGLIAATYALLAIFHMGDRYLFPIVSMLGSLGMIMVYRLDGSQARKQLIWFAAGIALFILSYAIYSITDKWYMLLYLYPFAAFALFAVTVVFGKSINGSNNWIIIKGYSFQPSELVKILFAFFLASYCTAPEKLGLPGLIIPQAARGMSARLVFCMLVYIHMAFLLYQREWGTMLLLFLVFFIMLYVLRQGRTLILINAVIAVAGGVAGYYLLYHIHDRITVWLNPWTDISGKGYQITQSLFAIGAGGFFGTGIGMGRPDLIPAVYTDFIFSAICEEMGIFGGMAVIMLFFILTYRGFKICLEVKNPFHKCMALSITLLYGFQAFIIIGGVIKLIPMTGITLPFVSYGGSSLISSFIALGILQAISRKAS